MSIFSRLFKGSQGEKGPDEEGEPADATAAVAAPAEPVVETKPDPRPTAQPAPPAPRRRDATEPEIIVEGAGASRRAPWEPAPADSATSTARPATTARPAAKTPATASKAPAARMPPKAAPQPRKAAAAPAPKAAPAREPTPSIKPAIPTASHPVAATAAAAKAAEPVAAKLSKPPETARESSASQPEKLPEKPPEKLPEKPPEGLAERQPEAQAAPFRRDEPTDRFLLTLSLDEQIDRITSPPAAPASLAEAASPAPSPASHQQDEQAIREVFRQLASLHLSPVRALVSEIRFGAAPTEWIAICKSAVESVRDAAVKMELTALAENLQSFLGALDRAHNGSTMIDGDRRAAVVAAYAALAEHLPEGFALDAGNERRRREPIIVSALLRSVPGVDRVAIRKVLAAGLRDLSRLSRARADEIAATSGLPLPLAEQISQRFARYHAESGTATVAPERHERARLSALVAELERNERAYREASEAWSDEAMAGKRRLRRERDTILCEVQVALARLGELESLQELEPMPIDRKLASLKRILQSHA